MIEVIHSFVPLRRDVLSTIPRKSLLGRVGTS